MYFKANCMVRLGGPHVAGQPRAVNQLVESINHMPRPPVAENAATKTKNYLPRLIDLRGPLYAFKLAVAVFQIFEGSS
jgi:hypothetical protein